MISILLSSVLVAASPLSTSSLIANEVIRSGEIITLENAVPETGELSDADEALLGKQVRRTVYAGKPVTSANTRAPYVIKRNQNVTVKYISGSLEITMSGRIYRSAKDSRADNDRVAVDQRT